MGFAEDFLQQTGRDIPVPSVGSLSERFSQLDIKVKLYTAKALQRFKEGKPVDLIVDSTGLKTDQAGEWCSAGSTGVTGVSSI